MILYRGAELLPDWRGHVYRIWVERAHCVADGEQQAAAFSMTRQEGEPSTFSEAHRSYIGDAPVTHELHIGNLFLPKLCGRNSVKQSKLA